MARQTEFPPHSEVSAPQEPRHPLDIVIGPPEAQALHDLDLEMNPGMRHLHWVTDPDSDYMRAKDRRDRENQITLIDILIRQDREAAAKFEETYGESMKNAAVAYKQVGREGYYNAERRAIKEESRLQIASGIAEGIEQQPAEERVAWVNGILEFIDAR